MEPSAGRQSQIRGGKPVHPNRSAEAREAVIDAHEPDAAILSCSDARVSPDIIFDAGIGDLFTVRTAGRS